MNTKINGTDYREFFQVFKFLKQENTKVKNTILDDVLESIEMDDFIKQNGKKNEKISMFRHMIYKITCRKASIKILGYFH